jgi:hypothetical protein
VILRHLVDAPVPEQVAAAVADVRDVRGPPVDEGRGDGRPHPGELRIALRRAEDDRAGLLDRLAEDVRERALLRRSLRRPERVGLGVLRVPHRGLHRLDREVRSRAAARVAAHAVRHDEQAEVLVDETRPWLQGARLTAWELSVEGIPYHLIADNMAGYFMSRGAVDGVVVGADRIAANGDTANKIGTYTLSVLAKEHSLPFYVAAPLSTVDLTVQSGADIPIEERDEDEVTSYGGRRLAPEGARAYHPAFDVTPHANITAIVTEAGVLREPFDEALRAACAEGHCT